MPTGVSIAQCIDCSNGLTLDDLCNEVTFDGTDFLREEGKRTQERAEHRAKANAVFENMMRRGRKPKEE